MTELILMPMSWLVSKSLATARMAIPTFVWLMSWVRASTKASTRKGVKMVTHLVEVPAIFTVSDRKGMVG